MKNRLFIYLSIICNVLSSCGEPIKAKYFSVSWLNYDDSIIKIDNEVLEGTIPVYEGETPIRQDEFYNYIFSNWEPEVTPIHSDMTYKATFIQEEKENTLYFSHQSGCYESSFLLSVVPSVKGMEIYYTLDGSIPTKDSTRYTSPIKISDISNNDNRISMYKGISSLDVYYPNYLIDKCVTINFVGFNKLYGTFTDVFHKTYCISIANRDTYKDLPIVSIDMDEEDLFDYEKGIYVTGKIYDESDHKGYPETYPANYNQRGREWERNAHITYFDAHHNYSFDQNIGIRIHGGWTRAFNQKSFNLYARKEYSGSSKFNKPFFDDVNEHTVMLRSGGYRDSNITKVRDSLNHDLASLEPFSNQKSFPVVLFLNGEYWGIYNLQERFTSHYIEKYFGIDKDDVLIIKNDEVDEGEANDIAYYNDLLSYFRSTDFSIENNYKVASDKYIDIDSFLSYISVELYTANIDWPGNNVRLWRNKKSTEDTRWRFMMYDTDDSSNILSSKCDYNSDPFLNSSHWRYGPLDDNCIVGLIFTKLLSNNGFKEQLINTIKRIGSENLSYQKVDNYLKDKEQLLQIPMEEYYHRFLSDNLNKSYFLNNINVIRSFYQHRYEAILAILDARFGETR